jgi:hypothetical protein
MKHILVLIITVLSLSVYSQDTLVMKSGVEIRSRIIEAGTIEIKYKNYDNLDGPLYIVPTSDVFMIKYASGTKDTLHSHTTSVPYRERDFSEGKPGKGYLIAGGVLTGVGGVFAVAGGSMFGLLAYQNRNYNNGTVSKDGGGGILLAVGGIAFFGISAPFLIAGPICIAKGVRLNRRASQASLWLVPTANGLALKF